METKPPIPRAILVSVQIPGVDDVAHAADLEELGRLVKTLGYEVVGTVSQKRDEIGGGTVLGKGRLAELAAMTGGTGVVGSMAIANAQTQGASSLNAQAQNATMIHKAACNGFWGRWCPPGRHRVCGPYRCWCAPCW